jgi:DNA-binding SARP family transcriptional activator
METPPLCIQLFDAFELRLGDVALPPFDSARAESLLAYLLLHRDAPQPRQKLAFLLWPDSTESQARTNLRHLLHTLRRTLPDASRYLDVTPRTLQWRADVPVWLDVAAFVDAISRSGRDADEELVALREAVELYTGDLLVGCYDEWIADEREHLRTRFLDALARLVALLKNRGDIADAIRYADRLLRHDPLREETYRQLMRLHDARGDRARALHVYHVCAATLERELGVEPDTATREAYDALLSHAPRQAESEASVRLGRPSLVGRGQERALLTRLWRSTESGHAQFVLVTGEPGVGKTSLVEDFRSWCLHHGAISAEARSYAAEGAISYAPVVSWLRAEGFKAHLGRLDRSRLTNLARLLPELLTEMPGLPEPKPLSEVDLRRQLFDAVARAIFAPGSPILLVADDIHWADHESLQFLHYLLRVEPTARLLVVATARREEIDQWHPLDELLTGLHALDRCTEIQIERLTQAETAMLAERFTGRAFAEPDADRLHRETEGNPLFVIESLRAGWTSGTDVRGRMSPKIQAVIEARLAKLSEPARELVSLAATIGREFTTEVLADAADTDVDALVSGLDELWRRRIVRERGADAYDFSHDRIREVAYRALSPARRRQAHLRVALALERDNAADIGQVSAQLANHFERAGLTEMAVAWYERAAASAQALFANGEAVRLLDRALDLLGSLPPTAERHQRELVDLAALAASLGWVEGWGSERLAAVHQRALTLAQLGGAELAPSLVRSMAIDSLSRRDFATAGELGQALRARGERDADDMLLVEADYVLGIAAFWQGHLEAARRHFESAVDRYRPEHRVAHLIRYGLDPKVVCLSRLANTLWFLGHPAAAIRTRDTALALADEIAHPYSRAIALVFAVALSIDMRDQDGIRQYTALLAEGPEEHGTRPTRLSTEVAIAYVDVLAGRAKTGIDRILRALNETGPSDPAPGMRAHQVRVLLEACVLAGDAKLGLAVADRALASEEGGRLWEAETRCLRAQVLAMLGAPAPDVEAELERALATARNQGAKMLELRAAVGLLRHRLKHGNGPAASQTRELLAEIVAALPERQDSPDLREAAALLGPN